ncbi:zinc-binding dehydrogenase [Devosia algicola]|uniref:Zinc-binding dehydrogenase n=2 Tax=Devosia algicola TaxID=3026418 RepID=A0ABY7YLK7_9HYPH|nr:zinc-binding dehydrogenase [Devosia algicola]WDR02053.1 zinc-binding dehydrogenase [Devosia algicola]
MAAAGDYVAVIDHEYRFDQIVEAHRRVDSKRKRGNVVVSMVPKLAIAA